MKKLSAITAATVFAAITATAFAGDTSTVTIFAAVDGACKVNSAPTITLTLDPSLPGNVSNSGNISLWCTKNTPFTVSDPGSGSTGTFNTVLAGNDAQTAGKSIPFTLNYNTGGTGAGRSSAVNSAVTATVLNGNFINAVAGSYRTTVTMTVSP